MSDYAQTTLVETARPFPLLGTPEFEALLATLAAGAVARDSGELSARPAIDLVREARLGVLRLPRALGGAGIALPDLYRTVIALAEADSNIPHILRNHFTFVERMSRNQHDERFRHWLKLVGEGRLFGSASGELDIANIGAGVVDTVLEPQGDGFRLTGRKYYSTGNHYMDMLLVRAALPDGKPIWAVIPTDREGVDVDDDWDGIGQRLTASGSTVFTDVRVHREETFLPEAEKNRSPASASYPQLWLTSIVTGILRAIVRDAIKVVTGRNRNYYHALVEQPARDPLLQQVIGRLASIAYVAEASVLATAATLGRAHERWDAGEPAAELFAEASAQAAKCKVVIDELALQAAGEVFNVGGASAVRQSVGLDRHWRNIRTISSHNPLSYKARALGEQALFGTPLPAAAFF